jgi:hypothetical protein
LVVSTRTVALAACYTLEKHYDVEHRPKPMGGVKVGAAAQLALVASIVASIAALTACKGPARPFIYDEPCATPCAPGLVCPQECQP